MFFHVNNYFSLSVIFVTLILPILFEINLSVSHLTSEAVNHCINFQINDNLTTISKTCNHFLYEQYIQYPKLPVASNFPQS